MELAPQLGVLGKAPLASRLGSGVSIIIGGTSSTPCPPPGLSITQRCRGKGCTAAVPSSPKQGLAQLLKKDFNEHL